MLFRFKLFLIAALASAPAFSDTLTSQQIDRDTWSVIAQSVADADIEAMAGTYHPDAVLISKEGTTPISQALAKWGEGMQAAARAGSQARVSFRFSQRLDNETTAFETGIFRYVAISASGEESVQYVHFESLLVKQGDHWRYLMERQLGATDQAAWDALKP